MPVPQPMSRTTLSLNCMHTDDRGGIKMMVVPPPVKQMSRAFSGSAYLESIVHDGIHVAARANTVLEHLLMDACNKQPSTCK